MIFLLLLNASLILGQVPSQTPRPPTPVQLEKSQEAAPQTVLPPAPVNLPPLSGPSTPITEPANPAQLPAGNPPVTGQDNSTTTDNKSSTKKENPASNGDKDNTSSGQKDEKKEKEDPNHPWGYGAWLKPHGDSSGFVHTVYKYYYEQFYPPEKKEDEPEEPEPPRRALPSPWHSPPFPNSEYQGFPLIGVPASTFKGPFQTGLEQIPCLGFGDGWKNSGIKFDAWATTFGDWANSKNSNVPSSYWITPNTYGLDQMVFKLEKIPDSVQTDHMDWGFRSTALYGLDYRYTTAGGWGSDQLLKHNLLYGWDPVEQYLDLYVPGFLGGTQFRVGRWIACPDIESQYSVDNYLGSHSILFTYDTYTQTGVMVTQKINDQLSLQASFFAGTDMAPWYKGAIPTGAFGYRYVTKDNNDGFYTWVNALNNAEFRHFTQYNQPLGHDNFNYFVTTWEHRFSEAIFTKTEGYFMWQRNAEVGGTPSAGPIQPYGGGGGDGTLLPGISYTYGLLNYTMFGLSKRDYFTVRNEWYRDERGMRTGYAGTYTSNTIGISHQFNDVLMLRPEIGYYRNWTNPAFDNGALHGTLIAGFDLTYRF